MKAHAIIAATLVLALAGCKKDAYDLQGSALLVVNGGSHSISILDLADLETKTVLSLDEGSRYPHHIYLSPAGQKFAVSITDTDLSAGHTHGSVPGKEYKVLVYETRTGKLLESIALEGMAHNAIFSPDGHELWVGEAREGSSVVHVYDTKRYKETHTITVGDGLSEVTFSADGSRAYAACTMDNSLHIIDPSTKEVLRVLTTGDAPVGAWPASNGRMYVDNETAYSVTEVSVSGDSILSTIAVGSKPGYVAYHAGTNRVWVSDARNGQVRVYGDSLGTWTWVADIPTGDDAHAIAFTPDGSRAFVTNQGANTVSVLDPVALTKLQDVDVELMPNGIAVLE